MIALLTVVLALPLFSGCGMTIGLNGRSPEDLVRGIIGLNDAPRIEFDDFYGQLLEEGRSWAGDKLRIGRISVGSAGTVGRSRGAAPIWIADIVRCDREEEIVGADQKIPKIKLCSGKLRQAVMSNLDIDGYEIGFNLGKEDSFIGSAVKPELIKVAAAEAQRLADAAMGSSDADSGRYVYELDIRRADAKPLWRVRKDCDADSPDGGGCSASDRWVVELEADTGKIISQEHL